MADLIHENEICKIHSWLLGGRQLKHTFTSTSLQVQKEFWPCEEFHKEHIVWSF